MRNKPAFNFPAFFEAERALREMGWVPLNPARMDVANHQANGYLGMSIEEQLTHASNPENARDYARRDLEVITSLRREDGDALVLLPDWEESIGARAEKAVAEWVGLRVLTLEEALNGAAEGR